MIKYQIFKGDRILGEGILPGSYGWVINFLSRWNEEYKTASATLSFKDGGVTNIKKEENLKPPGEN